MAILVAMDVTMDAHNTSKLCAQTQLLCICGAQPSASGDYNTGHGNPSILGKRHMSPDYRPVESTREVTTPVQTKLPLVVDLYMCYLAPGINLQGSSSLSLIAPKPPNQRFINHESEYVKKRFLLFDENLITVLSILSRSG